MSAGHDIGLVPAAPGLGRGAPRRKRQDTMKIRARSMFTVLASVGVLVSACAPPGGEAHANFDPSQLVATTPPGSTEVDHVNWALPAGEPTSLDPLKVGAESGYTVTANLCENLLALNPDFSVGPNLATSAEWANDTTFVIKLRQDVTFWDGKPMTAEDVAYSIRRQADPKGAVHASNYAGMTKVAETGPLEVTLNFAAHDAQFRNTLASNSAAIFQKAYTESHAGAIGTPSGGLMCTGPYQLRSWTAGQRIVTTAYPGYRSGAPLVKRLDYLFVSGHDTLTNAMLSGEIDGSFTVPVEGIPALQRSGAGDVFIGPSTQSAALMPTRTDGPMALPAVRQALNLALDKKALIKAVLGGYGEPQKTFIPQLAFRGLPGAEIYQRAYDELPDNARDLAAARKLMQTVKLDRTKVDLAIRADDTQWTRIATVVQAAGAELGLQITITQLQGTDFAGLYHDASARRKHDLLGASGYLTTAGVLTYSGWHINKGSLFNYTGYANAAAVADWKTAKSSIDPDVAARSYVEAQALFAPDNLQITLANQYTRTFLAKDLTGVTTSLSYISSPWALRLGGKA